MINCISSSQSQTLWLVTHITTFILRGRWRRSGIWNYATGKMDESAGLNWLEEDDFGWVSNADLDALGVVFQTKVQSNSIAAWSHVTVCPRSLTWLQGWGLDGERLTYRVLERWRSISVWCGSSNGKVWCKKHHHRRNDRSWLLLTSEQLGRWEIRT